MTQQGSKASEVFSGRGQSEATKLFYNGSADLFAKVVKENLASGKYSLADLGGHKGEFLSELLTKLPEYEFDSVIVDREDGIDLGVKATKIKGDIRNTAFENKSIDLVIVRFVLAWNALENQKSVLKEISRITKRIAIIQHQGADSSDPIPLQQASVKIFAGIVPKLKREGGFFTESRKVEEWMTELGINFEKVEEKRVDQLSGTFIERFDLTQEEGEVIKNTLQGCDYLNLSTYILRF